MLGAIPLATARPAIVIALNRFARAQRTRAGSCGRRSGRLQDAVCLGDELPQAAAIALDDLLPPAA